MSSNVNILVSKEFIKPASCWDRFDWVSYLSYADISSIRREKSFQQEMSRVGLPCTPYPNIRTPFEAQAVKGLHKCRLLENNPAYVNITIGHLRMVKSAWVLGAQHGLFFENDARFLKDEDKLHEIVESIPADYDLALLDWVLPRKHVSEYLSEFNKKDLINGHWKRFSNARSCACYAMSSKGMKKYIQLIENSVTCGSKLKICDQYWFDMNAAGLTCYCCFPNAAVQGVPGGSTDYSYIAAKYREIGISRTDYSD